MRQLIVTADDYGMSKAVNSAIDQGISAGLISSTNVMTNMDYYEEAEKLAKENVSVGLHWVLTCGKPVLQAGEIPSLVREDGYFYSYPEFRQRYRKGLISNEDIKKELIAQYERYVQLLGNPDYWNTHQNVHVDFKIYGLFVSVAVELGIHSMRSHQRIYVPASQSEGKISWKWRLVEPLKSRLLNIWQGRAHRKGIASPNGLIVLLRESDANDLNYVFSHIDWGKNEIGEYVIHPATEEDSPYFGRIGKKRIQEYLQFTAEDTRKILAENEIRLSNYGDIQKK